MALQEKHRTRLYAHLVDHVGEETAEAVLSQFPARDLDEPVTKEFVALTAAELRAELAEMETRLTLRLSEQTDRVMNRVQWVVGVGFVAFSVVSALLR